ncbi:MAG: hypothetical protein ABR595_03195 [Psychroflexus sp.]
MMKLLVFIWLQFGPLTPPGGGTTEIDEAAAPIDGNLEVGFVVGLLIAIVYIYKFKFKSTEKITTIQKKNTD